MQREYKKISLVKPIAELVAILLLLSGITYAWFYQGDRGTVESLKTDVINAYNVSISNTGEGLWATELNITNGTPAVVRMSEYSGNGRDLYKPIYNLRQLYGFYRETDEKYAASAKKYIEFEIDAKSDGNVDLFLSDESYVRPVCEGEDASVEVREKLANYKDYISGAVRIAIYDKTSNTTVVWAPNSTYQYTNENVHTTKGQPESEYSFVIDEIHNKEPFDKADPYALDSVTTKIYTNGQPSGIYKNEQEGFCFLWGDVKGSSEGALPVIKLEADTEKTLTVRVWIEGCDREAVQELIDGRFRVHLDFRAESAKGGSN